MAQIVDKPMFCIAIGLAVLICGQLWPQFPVIAGVALIASGACLATLRRTPTAPLLLVIQLFVYISLITLFLGARLHAASIGNVPLGLIDLFDFSLAIVLIAIVYNRLLI